VEELSRKLGVGIVGGVIDVKILVIANIPRRAGFR